MTRTLATLGLCVALGGCSTLLSGSSPASTLYAIKSAKDAATVIADRYAHLPRCGGAQPPVCSQLSVVKSVDLAAKVADDAINSAENLVRNPTTGNVASAVAAAQAALTALQKITQTLKVQ